MQNTLKIITAKDLQLAEKKYFLDENIKEEKLMTAAATHVANYILKLNDTKKIILLIGKGNNGADAYATGIILLKQKKDVTAYQLYPYSETSALNKKKHNEFKKLNGAIKFIKEPSDLEINDQLIIDGIFGIGFRNTKNNFIDNIITKVNESNSFTISIDVPSGLDATTGIAENQAIKANVTISFSLPKIGFFFNDGINFIGKLINVDIGIEKRYLNKIRTSYYLPNEDDIKKLLPKIKNNRHKYEMSVIGIAGCKKYIGAAKLSCLSALRSGAGIVKLFYPKQDAYFDNFPYEIIKEEITKNNIEKIMKDCQLAKSIFIGPGLGEMTPLLKIILKKVLLKIKDIPIVIDADGLTYFNMIKKKMTFNTNIILTPHKKEMMRLLNLKDHLSDSLFLPLCDDFCKHHNILLILKGAITYLFHPQHDTLAFNFADPGMATAGTGDVLTGIIASLLAQKTSLYKAAILGIYLHSKAGKLAAEIKTPYCMIASDIINYLPDIFKKINNIF